jgi:HTH-type transcriptional regulator/antitoxin HipB
MSYIRDMTASNDTPRLTAGFGQMLRAERRKLGLTQAQLAARAGIGRQKLIEVEQGKPGVAFATYAAAMSALGVEFSVKPRLVRIGDFPQLGLVAWNRSKEDMIPERDALSLYERSWDMVDCSSMTPAESAFLDKLVQTYGNGVLHV